MPTEKSAGAIIFYQDDKKIEYLLLRYEAGHWDFPKGHIEKGEEKLDTVRREVREETGIGDIEIIPGFKEEIGYFYRKPKNWFPGRSGKIVSNRLGTHEKGANFKTVTFYLARVKMQEVKLSSEHVGYVWLSYKKAIYQLTFQNAKDILTKARAFMK